MSNEAGSEPDAMLLPLGAIAVRSHWKDGRHVGGARPGLPDGSTGADGCLAGVGDGGAAALGVRSLALCLSLNDLRRGGKHLFEINGVGALHRDGFVEVQPICILSWASIVKMKRGHSRFYAF